MTSKDQAVQLNASEKPMREMSGEVNEDIDEICGGLVCPRCSMAVMQYNGLLELTCPNCGYRAAGAAFT